MCRISFPIFAVFAVQPYNSAEISLVLLNSKSTALLQMSALELFLDVALHLLRKRSLFVLPSCFMCDTIMNSLRRISVQTKGLTVVDDRLANVGIGIVPLQGVALYGAVALNSADFDTVASNSALFIHLSIHPRHCFLISVA